MDLRPHAVGDPTHRRAATRWTAALREKGIDVEMHDLRRVVCILTATDDAETVERLGNALAEIPAEKAVIPLPPYQQPLPERAMSPREAVMGASVYVPLHQAAGRVAAAAAGLYPPGIPLTAPGEIFTEETTRTLAQCRGAGPLWCRRRIVYYA